MWTRTEARIRACVVRDWLIIPGMSHLVEVADVPARFHRRSRGEERTHSCSFILHVGRVCTVLCRCVSGCAFFAVAVLMFFGSTVWAAFR